ncbi:hypothetical protein OESDEN_25405 [Oesophagostomum dentatum]|uniref:Uncharacterized protein n=1 Tax=Oesophagostomum dentatum TaxID=61180 RepID=A0A0B1RQS0_OESDE|nr:hypothetical protein OESDEN_25405 [Oesophagostomum dentatum]
MDISVLLTVRGLSVYAPLCVLLLTWGSVATQIKIYTSTTFQRNFTKMMIRAEVLHQPLRWWRKNKWLDVLSKAMKKLREGRYRRAFSKASFDFD